jgi:hypothetical protein
MAVGIVTAGSERPRRLFAVGSMLIICLPKLQVFIPTVSFSGNSLHYYKLNQPVTFCDPKHESFFPQNVKLYQIK